MPLYDFECKKCQKVEEVFRRMSESKEFVVCKDCLEVMERVYLNPPMVKGDLEDYVSPVTGKLVSGRRQRREDLARTNCRPYEDGEREEFLKRREAVNDLLDKRIEATVEEQVEKMPTRKRELLGQELAAGAHVEIERISP